MRMQHLILPVHSGIVPQRCLSVGMRIEHYDIDLDYDEKTKEYTGKERIMLSGNNLWKGRNDPEDD